MIDDLIRPDLLSGVLHKSYFLTIGRALFVAQHFEQNCRGLADFLDIKHAVHSGVTNPLDEGFRAFFLQVRKRMLGGAVKKLTNSQGTPTEFLDLLTLARDARNEIAHKAALGADHPFGDDEDMWPVLEHMLEDLRKLADADAVIAALLYHQNEHELLLVPKAYTDDVLRWVFQEYKGEDFVEHLFPI